MMTEFNEVMEIAPGGNPCFDTKDSQSFWYVDDDRDVVRYDLAARNSILPFSSRDEITENVVARLRARRRSPRARPPGGSRRDPPGGASSRDAGADGV